MKRFLSVLLTLMLVFTLSSTIVMAEPAEQVEVATMPEQPADYDESTLSQYVVFDFTDPDTTIFSLCTTGDESSLNYQVELSEYYGQEVKETERNGQRAIVSLEEEIETNELSYKLISYFGGAINFTKVNEKNVFADVSHYVISSEMVNMTSAQEGEQVLEAIVKFGEEEKSFEFLSGGESAYMVTRYFVNWVNVLIAIMCLAVLVLLVVIIVLSKKKKNKEITEDLAENPEENVLSEEIADENAEDAEALEQNEVIEEVEAEEIEVEEVIGEQPETENNEEN